MSTISAILKNAEDHISLQLGQPVRVVWFHKRRELQRVKKVDQEKIDVVLNAVSATFGQSVEDILSISRRRVLSDSRFAAFKLLLESINMNNCDVARLFGRDHTAVIYGVKCCVLWSEIYPEYAAKYNEAKRIIEEIIA